MRQIVLIFIIIMTASYTAFAQRPDCDYKVEILIDGDEFDSEEFAWRMKATKVEGVPTNITGTAKIQSNGKIVKSYKPWSSDSISRQKTSSKYSPNLKPGDYEVTAEINVECGDTNNDNNIAAKEIKIKGEAETKSGNNDKEEKGAATYGKNEIGATSKKAADEAVLPIQPRKLTAKKPAETDNIIQLTTSNDKNKLARSTASAVQQPQIVYESSNEKVKGLVMIFLLALSVLLNIILIWKR